MTTLTLTAELYCTTVHPRDGRELEDGWLEPGALVRNVSAGTGPSGEPVYWFEASTDGGRIWYAQKSYTDPRES